MKHIFKTSICMWLVITTLTISSCKKKSEDGNSNSIIGKWTVRSYVITNFENTGKDQDDTKGDNPRPTFEFSSDGIFKSTLEQHYVQTIGYKISGSQVSFDEEIAFEHKSFTYQVNGNILLLTRTDTHTTGNITYIENTTITLDRM